MFQGLPAELFVLELKLQSAFNIETTSAEFSKNPGSVCGWLTNYPGITVYILWIQAKPSSVKKLGRNHQPIYKFSFSWYHLWIKRDIANQNAYQLPFREFLLLLFFFFKNERKISLHLHVSKKSRVVGKYKGGFLGIDLSLLWKATKPTSCYSTHSEKTFQLNQEM